MKRLKRRQTYNGRDKGLMPEDVPVYEYVEWVTDASEVLRLIIKTGFRQEPHASERETIRGAIGWKWED